MYCQIFQRLIIHNTEDRTNLAACVATIFCNEFSYGNVNIVSNNNLQLSKRKWGTYGSWLILQFNKSLLFTGNKTRTTRMPAFWDTRHHHRITHTSDSHQIPSQNKTKSKLQLLKDCQKVKLCKNLYTRHTFWRCSIRCINMKRIQPEL